MSDTRVDGFASRMRGYELPARAVLVPRTPVIVRVDGKCFSRFTRGMTRPYDVRLAACMQSVALRLASEAQNCRLAYWQSDEVSLLLTDFRTLTTQPWFDNEVQKVCSISAAFATAAFNEAFIDTGLRADSHDTSFQAFDARCFNLPKEEVANYFVWRQRDAERNSVQMTAHAHFSHKELQGLDRRQMKEMLVLQRGIDWETLPAAFRRGSVAIKELERTGLAVAGAVRSKWEPAPAPAFSQDRDFIERFLREEEDRVARGPDVA